MSPGHASAPLRVERALSAGLLCGPGGAAAHVLAGGTPPTATALLLVTAAALAGAGLASARRLGPVALLGLAGAAQLVFHHAFGPAPAGGHAMHGGSMATPVGGEASMVLAHVVVAVLVATVAGGLEASWWAIVRAGLLRLLPHLPAQPVALPVVGRLPGVTEPACAVPTSVDAPEVVGPRGPPVRRGPAATTAPLCA
ncbi:hypothetical protein [Nocardioides sp. CFH 31398]|uniref:hypothetical protein n=1 Tax=Nocardioides sp. CFH 31398 TaxID=2919579 RepID=UPI001F06742D|nr:hypothetical protein [Nocardioides sp. CFH 31398]MCH1867865.1 hypothetical protein [Nocardioides sp. CFH 31398]